MAGDRNGDGLITVEEIVAATYADLNGCIPDLQPLSVTALACPGGCGPQRIEVCVLNSGPLGTSRGFAFTVDQQPAGEFGAVGAGAEACVDVAFPFGGATGGDATLIVDSDNVIPELDENNNSLSFPEPNPTACDLICSP
ncbi:MAG TPA: hypothetical protein VMT89_04245 [Candidatus Acidoferrales bacterium]|nr:hypothetical protein [Candidatus Acidoferrales bacterium]